MEARLAELERRVARAERQARRARGAALAALVLAASLGLPRSLPSQNRGSTTRAPFQIVDGRGKPILAVEADPGEGRRLRLFGPKGELLAHLGDAGAGGEFSVYGATGKSLAGFLADSDSATLQLSANPGKGPAVQLNADPKGGSLAIRDRDGKAILERPQGNDPAARAGRAARSRAGSS